MASSERPLRLGLIGCGRVAHMRYLPVLNSFSKAQLTAIADPHTETLNTVQRRFPSAKAFTNHKELVENSDVEAVIIATPPPTHAPVALDAIAAGRHALVEKPFATAVADAEMVVNAARSADVKIMVGFNKRRISHFRQARRLLEQRALGQPYSFECTLVSGVFDSGWKPRTDFLHQRSTGGGAIFELSTHQIDLLRYLLGQEVVSVRCRLQSRRSQDDTSWLWLTLESGVEAFLHCGFGPAAIQRVDILCDNGRISFPNSYSSLWVGERSVRDFVWGPGHAIADYAHAAWTRLHRTSHPEHLSFITQLSDFVDYVRKGQEPTPSAMDGLANTMVIEAAYRSAEQDGAPISLTKVA